MINSIKLVITDIDGVWTDGGMYYDGRSTELKCFHTGDSAGVLFCRLNDVKVAIITGENSPIVARRARKLGIELVVLGARDKLAEAKTICESLGIDLSETAFIGDDINDIRLLKAVGFAAVVPTAPEYVMNVATYVTGKRGGEGAFRDFVEHLLMEADLLDATIRKYLEQFPAD
jgi:3-deoxy-D-glycero-D-galacto-nononate 9-phosphatase